MAQSGLTLVQQKKLLIGVGAVIAAIGWLQFFYLPTQRALSEARSQVEQLSVQLNQVKSGIARLPAMQEEITRLSAEFQLPTTPKPPEQQLPELLDEISKAARRSQIQILGQKPRGNVSALVPGPSGYLEVPVMIMATGGYHQIGQFLDLLESSPQLLLRVRELGIMGNPDDLYRHGAFVLFHAYLVPGAPARSDE